MASVSRFLLLVLLRFAFIWISSSGFRIPIFKGRVEALLPLWKLFFRRGAGCRVRHAGPAISPERISPRLPNPRWRSMPCALPAIEHFDRRVAAAAQLNYLI